MLVETASVSARMPTPRSWPNLSGQTILVTGASSGIGRATAVGLAECGADLVLIARREMQLAEVCDEIGQQQSVHVTTFAADLRDARSIRRIVDGLPRLDGLVNNAGRNIPGYFADVDEPSFDAVFELNVKAVFFVSQACVSKIRESGRGGAIVNVSSQMGHVGAARRTVYCASKHAIEGFTKALALELAPEAIRVNSVCPTFVATPMTEPMFEDAGFRDEVVSRIPLGRVGTAGEVVGAVAFLLSSAASLITGASLLVDGGWTAQ